MISDDALGMQHCIRNCAFNGHLQSTERRVTCNSPCTCTGREKACTFRVVCVLICAWDGWHDSLHRRSVLLRQTERSELACASLAREPPGRVQNSALCPASSDSSLCVPTQESALASRPKVQLHIAQDDTRSWVKAATTLKSFMSNV